MIPSYAEPVEYESRSSRAAPQANSHAMKTPNSAVGIATVIAAELNDIANRRGDENVPVVDAKNWTKECHNRKLFGICLSGGGIRSATFSLGVLQGLSERGLLPKADYLSTVSGGGYIGSWLQGVLYRRNAGPKGFDVLTEREPGRPNSDPISFLRKYSDYLSPRSGLSLDAVVVPLIWLRNALLNQAIFVSAFMAVFLVLWFLPALVQYVDKTAPGCIVWVLLTLCAVFGIVVVYWIGCNLKSIVRREIGEDEPPLFPAGEGTERVGGRIVLPMFLAVIFLVLSLLRPATVFATPWGNRLGFVGLWLLLAALQWRGGFVECWTKQHVSDEAAQDGFERAVNWVVPRAHVLWIAAASAGLVFGLFVGLYKLTGMWQHTEWTVQIIAWLPPLYLIALTLGVGLQIGLMGRDFPDASREWLARVGALSWVVAFGWAATFAIGILSPYWIAKIWPRYWPAVASAITVWAGTTFSSVLAGKSGKTGPEAKDSPGFSVSLDAVARYGPFLAVPGFLVLMAYILHLILGFNTKAGFLDAARHFAANYWESLPYDGQRWCFPLLLLAALCVIFVVMSFRININEFSLHHFYKNRLVRCFLGASAAKKRQPDSFTGFDPQDDIPLSALGCASLGGTVAPYPVLNATVTVTVGSELATQERKAVPWFFTPLYSGFAVEDSAGNEAAAKRGASMTSFVPTGEILGGGMRVGTAMAISGAALNPSSGYHSAPQTAFLMTLFDVRLGWWIGNPRNAKTYRGTGPRFALFWLLRELFGFVSERSEYLNLSDGGNFENLGLYELIRRRCRYVIAVDGEEDPSYVFESLGGAVRKCREDFGVEIDIDARPIVPKDGASSTHCVVGRIFYPNNEEPGWLLYIKSSLVGDEPEDVKQYHRQHLDFPQQPTTEQFFLESQFESYRRLGQHIARTTFTKAAPPIDLDKVFTRLQNRWTTPPQAPPGAWAQHAASYLHLVERLAGSQTLTSVDGEFVDRFPPAPPSREETLFRIELLQLMETVFFDLGFANAHSWNHPANAGWQTVFKYWASRPAIQALWQTQKSGYSKPFQDFMDTFIGPPPGLDHVPPWQAV
jgi:patatin-like phospholipase